jgi:transposase-like protein
MESKQKPTPTYTAEFRKRGVRLYREHRPDYTSDNAAYRAIASKPGCSHDTLRAWCLQAPRDGGVFARKIVGWRVSTAQLPSTVTPSMRAMRCRSAS